MKVGLLLALVIFLGDRLLKVFILNNFALGEVQSFIPGLVQLTYVRNTGMAFGFLTNQQWIPLVLTPLILIGLAYLLFRKFFTCRWQQIALLAVMAGGLANWIDRLAYGYVVDMFELVFMRFAVFNIADIFVSLGGIGFLVAIFVSEMRRKKETATEETDNA